MADPTYRYLINDGVTGNNLGEVNLSGVSYSWGLNGMGSFSGTIQLDDAKAATPNMFRTLASEILVLRDNVPVFNGPIIGLQANLESNTLTITGAPVWWYMTRRTMELSLDYTNADMSIIFDGILSTVNGKFAADIRLTRATAYNTTGQNYTISYPASSRKIAADAISDLAQVYPGFDWYISLSMDAATGKCKREYNVYAPFKGSLVTQGLTAANLATFQQTDDGTRVFNRVHEMGAGTDQSQFLVSRSAYEPAPYTDFGTTLTGWTTGHGGAGSGAPAINSAYGLAPPAFANADDSFQRRSIGGGGIGVGSSVEFDIFSTSNTGTMGTNNKTYVYFGCDASGNGQAFVPNITAGTPAVGIMPTNGYAISSAATVQYGNRVALGAGTYYHVRISIDTTTTCRLFINDDQIYRWNSATTSYDLPTWPITLNGDNIGIWDNTSSSTGLTIVDNFFVTAPTSTYVQPAIPYVERVQSRTDVSDFQSLHLYATADLFLGAWPSLTYQASFRPSATLPYNFVTPGDTVPLDINRGYLQVSGTKRVITITTNVEDSGGEIVTLGFNDTHA